MRKQPWKENEEGKNQSAENVEESPPIRKGASKEVVFVRDGATVKMVEVKLVFRTTYSYRSRKVYLEKKISLKRHIQRFPKSWKKALR